MPIVNRLWKFPLVLRRGQSMMRMYMKLFLVACMFLCCAPISLAQTSITGALAGTITDSTGAVVPGAKIVIVNQATRVERSTVSGSSGRYNLAFLLPGTYQVNASKEGFKSVVIPAIDIVVTETAALNISFEVGAASATVTVEGTQEMVQTDSSAQGRVIDSREVVALPLVTRNFTQILGLSAGVNMAVNNAADLGKGGSSSSGGYSGAKIVNGARPYDNNFQMNGVPVNDNLGVGSGTNFGSADVGGGIPVSNPDAIQEFKVLTGQYDASFGRDAGGNVNIITKVGTDKFHGSVFEFFRNDALNANEYFRKQLKQPRGVLRQNQFGFTLGGPTFTKKLLFFTSYQGTRQSNGIAAGCSAILQTPPLTNDRSAAGLGALFGGKTGTFGGVAIKSDGSNINPIALTMLNLKFADGKYLFPTPQTIDPSQPFAIQGRSSFSIPCTFTEDQVMGNIAYQQSEKSTFYARYFQALSNQVVTLGLSNVPGIPAPSDTTYRNFSLSNTYILTSHLVNEAILGYNNTRVNDTATMPATDKPFDLASMGSNVPSDFGPTVNVIFGSDWMQTQPAFLVNQPALSAVDSLAWSHGLHQIRVGGSIRREYISMSKFELPTATVFLGYPDFLLGLPGGPVANGGNGSPFSNVIETFGGAILMGRKYRKIDADLYFQDDYKILPTLTLNLGFRYDRIGALGDALGRASTFDFSAANPNAPASGSLQGFIVAGNSTGTPPAGVAKTSHNYAINGDAQNNWSPRIGFAWQVFPRSSTLVLHGGYGIYQSEIPAVGFLQGVITPPWVFNAATQGTANPGISFQNPFGPGPFPTLADFPLFTPYSPTAPIGQMQYQNPRFRSGYAQEASLDVQSDLGHNFLLEVAYVGTHGEHLSRGIKPNQAYSASPTAPVRGQTTNTLANINQRVPILGFTPVALVELNSGGASWFNALEASLTKRLSHGLQFLASYTFSKALDTDALDVVQASGGTAGGAFGDQRDPRARYGRINFDRPHRLVVSYTYDFPQMKSGPTFSRTVLNGWQLSGVTTYQSGTALTITANNSFNAFGQTNDFAVLTGSCSRGSYVKPGQTQKKLNSYWNTSCFSTKFPVIGSDGQATGFGNSGVGIANGPSQRNWDMAFTKHTKLGWPHESPLDLEFRGELFNAFNTPQFGNPDTGISNSTFGEITSTSVNPRIVQFALKLNY
ncbi:MAG: TonB-dependent receptor [Acidobacteria bacterium]|nr:TonB-dependent receptor [Acidobacteriota bacterium]